MLHNECEQSLNSARLLVIVTAAIQTATTIER